MKFASSNSSKQYLEPAASITLSGNKVKSFQRISPFQLKPENLSQKERDDLHKHICQIKTSYSAFKHYFVEQRLYKPTQLVDTFWEIAWFGHHLPMEQLAQFLREHFKNHPSKLLQLMIQHRGVENGKKLTSLTIIFEKYFWLSSESEFTVVVGQKKVMGVIKPGWNQQKTKEMFSQADDEHKFHWILREQVQKENDVSQDEEVSLHSDEEFEVKPSKKHKPITSFEEALIRAKNIPQKEWLRQMVQGVVKAECALVKEEVLTSFGKLQVFLQQIKAKIQSNADAIIQQKKHQVKTKDEKKKGGKNLTQAVKQAKVDQQKLENLLGTPKMVISQEDEAQQK